MAYDKMGNITSLIRTGNAPTIYSSPGMTLDYLTLTYSGNQLKNVTESATLGNILGFTKANGSAAIEYVYNKNGALTQDLNRGIAGIKYNSLNLPERIQFVYGHSSDYTYDAAGVKRTVLHTTVNNNLNVPMGSTTATNQSSFIESTMTDYYCGHIIYENTQLKQILTPEGYLTKNGASYDYHFYLRDHLGNNRSVLKWDGIGNSNTNCVVVQETNYYPSGMEYLSSFSGDSYNPGAQPYKFNGCEYMSMHGLNETDLGNRAVYNALNSFTTIDRYAEKFPWQSPYVHAGNNSVRYIDINGDSIWIEQRKGFLGLGGKETLRYENGNLYNKDGSEYTGKVKGFLGKTVAALNTVGKFDSGKGMLNELQNSTNNFTIAKTFNGNTYNTGSNTIKFNPSSTEGGLNTRGTTDRPAFIGLAHEMAHALDDNRGTINLNTVPGQTFTYAEQFASHLENQIRTEHFLPLRTHQGIDATTGAGIYPLVNSGNSIYYPGYNYNNALKIKTPAPPFLR